MKLYMDNFTSIFVNLEYTYFVFQVLNACGNLGDACNMAAVGALKHFHRPDVTVEVTNFIRLMELFKDISSSFDIAN